MNGAEGAAHLHERMTERRRRRRRAFPIREAEGMTKRRGRLVIKSDGEDSYDYEVDTSWTYGQLRDYLEQMGDGTIWVESGDGAEL